MNLLKERINPYQKESNRITKAVFEYIKANWFTFIDFFEDGSNTEIEGDTTKIYFTIPRVRKKHRVYINAYLENEVLDSGIRKRGYDINGVFGSQYPKTYIRLEIRFNKTYLDNAKLVNWKDLYFSINRVVTHEYEHALQYYLGDKRVNYDFWHNRALKNSKSYQNAVFIGNKQANPLVGYWTILKDELESELQAYWLLAKKLKNTKKYRNQTRGGVFVNFVTTNLKYMDFTLEEINYVISKWREYAKKHFPYMKF